jgi:predicted PurR-regulated permease PerM
MALDSALKESQDRPVLAHPADAGDPQTIRSASLLTLALLAVVYTLYVGIELLMPITLALLLNLLLQGPMRVLTTRLRLPNPVAALVVMLVLFGCVGLMVLAVSVPASAWITKAPESLSLLQDKLEVLRRPLGALQHVLHGIETATQPGTGSGGGQPVTVQPASGMLGDLFSGTTLTLSRIFTILVILFFLLSAGDRLLRGLVEIMPRFQEKRQVVEIATEIQQNVSAYLLTITGMNALVGIATGLAMWLCGLPNPLLWAAAAFLLNFVPILGPLAGVGMFLAVGLVSLEWPWQAFLPAVLYLAIHLVEGETVTPMLLANQFTLNPVLVIVSLFFWHAIWGVPGAFLAVPLLATAKIVCDRIEPLRPLGHVMGS